MPLPATPSLTLTRLSSSSFSAAYTGGDASATHYLQYRVAGAALDTQHPDTPSGASGSFAPVTGLADNATVVAYCYGVVGTTSSSLPHFQWKSLASPDDLAGAVHAFAAGDPALSEALVGGLWTGEVPEGTAMPYAWLETPETVTVPNFVTQMESHRVNVHVWAAGARAASAAARLVKARFDYATLPAFGDQTHIGTLPRSFRLQCENLRDSSSRLIYRAVVTLHLLCQLPR
jgi:hypothetical protein